MIEEAKSFHSNPETVYGFSFFFLERFVAKVVDIFHIVIHDINSTHKGRYFMNSGGNKRPTYRSSRYHLEIFF